MRTALVMMLILAFVVPAMAADKRVRDAKMAVDRDVDTEGRGYCDPRLNWTSQIKRVRSSPTVMWRSVTATENSLGRSVCRNNIAPTLYRARHCAGFFLLFDSEPAHVFMLRKRITSSA